MGPSLHLSWSELACHDPARTPYPAEWRATRAVRLAAAFELLRAAAGVPLLVASGYRTPAWNRRVGGARHSQHLEGRALDLVPVRGMTVADLYQLAFDLATTARDAGGGWLIRGLGQYYAFVHIDVRPATRLSRWGRP